MERLGMLIQKQRGITPEKAVEIFKKHGSEISIEEAKIILDLLYNFAKLVEYQEITRITNHNHTR